MNVQEVVNSFWAVSVNSRHFTPNAVLWLNSPVQVGQHLQDLLQVLPAQDLPQSAVGLQLVLDWPLVEVTGSARRFL